MKHRSAVYHQNLSHLRCRYQGLGCAGALKCTEVHLIQSNAARVASSEVNEVYLEAKLLFWWNDSGYSPNPRGGMVHQNRQ